MNAEKYDLGVLVEGFDRTNDFVWEMIMAANDVRWIQRFSNYKKALRQLSKFKVKLRETLEKLSQKEQD